MRGMKISACLTTALLLGMSLSTLAAAEDLPPMRSVDLFGQSIEYYDVGSGPAIVLLHVLGSSARNDWGACITRLAAHHRVLAPDQLGFGASAKPVIDYGIQTWVDFLGEFLRVEKVRDFTLAGESLGGWIAAQYAIQALGSHASASAAFQFPAPIRLVLVDAAGHRRLAEGIAAGGHNGLSLAGSKALLSAIFFDPARSTDEAARAQFAASMSKGDGWTIHSLVSNHGIVAESVDDQLGQITIPTLVIWGANDRLIPLEDGKDYAARIPGAKLVVVPECGHAPVIEKPEIVCAAIEQVLGAP
jgi:pimeloyl-ACP methyl ester carboxylesterase